MASASSAATTMAADDYTNVTHLTAATFASFTSDGERQRQLHELAWQVSVGILATLGVFSNVMAAIATSCGCRLAGFWLLSLFGCLLVVPVRCAGLLMCRYQSKYAAHVAMAASCLFVFVEIASTINMAVVVCTSILLLRRKTTRKNSYFNLSSRKGGIKRCMVAFLPGTIGVLVAVFAASTFGSLDSCFNENNILLFPVSVICLVVTLTLVCALMTGKCIGGNPVQTGSSDDVDDSPKTSKRRASKECSKSSDEEEKKLKNIFQAMISIRRHTVANIIGTPFYSGGIHHSSSNKIKLEGFNHENQQPSLPASSATRGFSAGDSSKRTGGYKYVRKWSVDVLALADQLENPKSHTGSYPVLCIKKPGVTVLDQCQKLEIGKKLVERNDCYTTEAASEYQKLNRLEEIEPSDDKKMSLLASPLPQQLPVAETAIKSNASVIKEFELLQHIEIREEDQLKRNEFKMVVIMSTVQLLFKSLFFLSTLLHNLSLPAAQLLQVASAFEWLVTPVVMTAGVAEYFNKCCRFVRSSTSLRFVCYCNLGSRKKCCAENG